MFDFHQGEKEIQNAAGVAQQADQLRGMVQKTLAPAVVQFLRVQSLAVLTTVDAQGAVWVSAIQGEPGFIHALNARQILIDAHTLPGGDILWRNLQSGEDNAVGMVVINFAQRRRVRINGTIKADGQFLLIDIKQSYANCPKYIQKRELARPAERVEIDNTQTQIKDGLEDPDRGLIAASDTFFIGTFAPQSGADASHRGGQPGFVEILAEDVIRFPDYAGNNLFNSLGNLATNPRLGLLFVDYQKGDALQLTGHATSVDPFRWHNGEKLGHIDVVVDKVISNRGGALGHWQFGEYSPYNP